MDYDFVNLRGYTLECVLTAINRSLIVAAKHNGRVFGGFVRKVIVPRYLNPQEKVKFRDVDIWFTNQTDADFFIKEMGSKLKGVPEGDVNNCSLYEFPSKQYYLIDHGTEIACIDVVVSDVLPVNDYDVNQLTCLFGDNGEIEFSNLLLVEAIAEKKAIMLDSYKKYIQEKAHTMRFHRNFMDRDWYVECDGKNILEKYPLLEQEYRHYLNQKKREEKYAEEFRTKKMSEKEIKLLEIFDEIKSMLN